MAPTEILASQHFETLSGIFDKLGVRTCLLKGGLSQKRASELRDEIASGVYSLIIGTHALISDAVAFKNLGLCVTDEQHRFGVAQRSALSGKSEGAHMCVISATPIPRTLALIIYGDLDVSVIDELPPGRTPVETYAVSESLRPRIERFIERLVREGRQVFVVCPVIEAGADMAPEMKSAEERAEALAKRFPDMRIGLVHGRMRPREKDSVMDAFARGETDLLVSTTVVEVGVDIPNAVLMVVENAERFGLSQLHQLRGRVGRGKHKSYCVLFNATGSRTASERLDVLSKSADGFFIASEDLRIRGPGDFFGNRQHGLPSLKIADLQSDVASVHEAAEAAAKLLQDDPELSAPSCGALREYIGVLFGERGISL